MKKALLALEDGRVFEGTAFGAEASHTGEICFNTSMTGYQEVLTDPSYRGQIVAMTYTMIGNYGVNPLDFESNAPHVRGFVIEELCDTPSNLPTTDGVRKWINHPFWAHYPVPLDRHGCCAHHQNDTEESMDTDG